MPETLCFKPPCVYLPLYNELLIVFLNCKLLCIKASAKLINVNCIGCHYASLLASGIHLVEKFGTTFQMHFTES